MSDEGIESEYGTYLQFKYGHQRPGTMEDWDRIMYSIGAVAGMSVMSQLIIDAGGAEIVEKVVAETKPFDVLMMTANFDILELAEVYNNYTHAAMPDIMLAKMEMDWKEEGLI